MRKRLFVLAGVVLALLVIGGVFVSLKGPSKSTCMAFVLNIEAGDTTKTYAAFTDKAQGSIDSKAWSKQVAALASVYAEAVPVSDGGPKQGTDSLTQKPYDYYEEDFTIKARGFTYKLSCTTTVAEPKKVDSFSSRIGV